MRLLPPLLIAIVTGSSFVHAQSRYDNPVDHRSYITDGEFKTYQPDKPRDTKGQKVVTNQIILLTGEPQLKSRTTADDLAAFIQSAESKAFPILARSKTPAKVLIQFNASSNGHEVKMASQGEPPESLLQNLFDAMKALAPLKTTGEVIFQLEIHVRP